MGNKMKLVGICNLERFKMLAGVRKAIAYLRKHGIRAATDSWDFGGAS